MESDRRGAIGVVERHPIHDDLHRVFLLLVERGDVVEPPHDTVDAHAHEAGLASLVEDLAKLALAVVGLGRQQGDLGLGRQGQKLAHDLARRARRDLAAAQVAALLASPRVEHAQVVVDLGHRADGRARVRRRRLLLDGDGGRQAADLVVLGLFQLPKELPRVGRQRLDVAPLPFGVQGVKGQRRFARSGNPGEYDELALGDRQLVDVQVVLARAANDDEIGFFGAALVLHFRAEGLLEEIGNAQGTIDEILPHRRHLF